MKLPTRIQQHKAESDSYAILVYKLRSLGIFRNVTESDYGIDFEVELVHGDQVTGRYFKAQVKSSEKIGIRKKDKVPVVGGIKESTLYYWTELSYKTHVILYAVDLKTEEIYVSKPIFWQAAALINGDGKSKSVEFIATPSRPAITPELKTKLPLLFTLRFALSPSLPDTLYAHKTALRYFRQFMSLYVDVFHYDFHCEIHDPDVLSTLLDVAAILLWNKEQELDGAGLSAADRKGLFSFDHWVRNSGDWATSEVTNLSAQSPVSVLIPLVVAALRRMRQLVFESKYYWSNMDRPYLKLVYETPLPKDTTKDTLNKWGYEFDKFSHQPNDFSFFVHIPYAQLEEAGIYA